MPKEPQRHRFCVPYKVARPSGRVRVGPGSIQLGNLILPPVFCCLFRMSLIEAGRVISIASHLHFYMVTVATSGPIAEQMSPCRSPAVKSPAEGLHVLPCFSRASTQLLKYLHVWAKHINLSICLHLPFQESIAIVTWCSDKRLEGENGTEARPFLL